MRVQGPASPSSFAPPAASGGRLSNVRDAVRRPKPASVPLVPPATPAPPRPAPLPHVPDHDYHRAHSGHRHSRGFGRGHFNLFPRSHYGRTWFVDDCDLEQWNVYYPAPVESVWQPEPVLPPTALPSTSLTDDAPLAPPPPEQQKQTEPLQVPPGFPPAYSSQQAPPQVDHLPPVVRPNFDVALNSPPPPLRFQDFPYAIDEAGYMSRLRTPKRWSARTTFEFGQDSYGLERTGLGLLVEHQTGVGLDFQWNSYREDLGGGATDELHFSDINFLYRVAEHENYLVRAGLGINILGDSFATDTGINFTTRLDVFPVKPIALTTEFDLGTIGDAETIHGAIRAGIMLDRFEFFGGYDYRRIGSVELKGPMAGLQIWF